MPDERVKPKTQKMRLSFNHAPRIDESPETVPVMDSNNVVLSPDGSEARAIEGSVITNTYRVVTDPPGRKAIIVETNPPDVDLGRMFLINNTAGGENMIEQIEFVRNPGIVEAIPEVATIQWAHASFSASKASAINTQFGIRTGNLGFEARGQCAQHNGTALVGVDYDDGPFADWVADAGSTELFYENFILPTATVGRYFYVDLIQPDNQLIKIGPLSRLFVTIVA